MRVGAYKHAQCLCSDCFNDCHTKHELYVVTEEASNTREFVSTEEEQQCFQMYKNWLYDYARLHYSYQCLRKNVHESDILPAITEKVWQFIAVI